MQLRNGGGGLSTDTLGWFNFCFLGKHVSYFSIVHIISFH